MSEKISWGDYVKSIGIDGLTKITKEWSRGVTHRGRSVHWYKSVWNKEWKNYFPVAACGKNLCDVNQTIGLALPACPMCVKAVQKLFSK